MKVKKPAIHSRSNMNMHGYDILHACFGRYTISVSLYMK